MTFNNDELQRIWDTIVQNTAILVGGNFLDNPHPNIEKVYRYLIDYLNKTDGLVRKKEPKEVKDYLTGIAVCARYLKNGYVCEKESITLAPGDEGYPLRWGEEYVLEAIVDNTGYNPYPTNKVLLILTQQSWDNWRWTFLDYADRDKEPYINLSIQEGQLKHDGTDPMVCWRLTKNSNSLQQIAEMLNWENIKDYRPGYTCTLSSTGVLSLEGSADESGYELYEVNGPNVTYKGHDTPTFWYSEFNLSNNMTKDFCYFAIGKWWYDGGREYSYATPTIKYLASDIPEEPRELNEAPIISFDEGLQLTLVLNYADPYWDGLAVSIHKPGGEDLGWYQLSKGTILDCPYLKYTPGTYFFQLHDQVGIESHSPITTVTIE